MNTSEGGTTPSSDGAEPNEAAHLWIAAYCLTIVLSLIGNSLVIAVVYKNANQRMRTPSNCLVVNMAVGDGLITLINMTTQVAMMSRDSGVAFSGVASDDVSCKLQNFIWIFLIFWSTGTLTAIAVDRFLLVFFPLKRIITLRNVRVIIAIILIIGAIISWPLLIYSAFVEYGELKICFVNMSSFKALRFYYISVFVAFIFFPLFALLTLYSAIGIRMCTRKSPGNPAARERMNRKLILMLVTIVVLFAFSWLPVSALYFGCFAYPNSESCAILARREAFFTLWFVAYSNSAINPYIYFVFNQGFRQGARAIWSSLRARVLGLLNSHRPVVSLELSFSATESRFHGRTDREETS